MTPHRPLLRPHLRPVAALLAIAATVTALDAPPQVTVRDFALDPMGNLAFHDDRVVLHPKLLLGAGADSNVYATKTDRIQDCYFEALAGLEARYDIGDSQRLTGNLEIESKRWVKEEDRDMIGGRGRLDWLHNDGAGLETRATAGYARIDDPLVESGVRIERGVGDGGIGVDWEGRTLRLAGGLAFVGEKYFDDGINWTAEERRNQRLTADATAGWRYASDAETYARIVGDAWRYPDETSRFRNSNGVQALAGWRAAPSTRTKVLAELGVEYRAYSGYYLDDSNYGDDHTLTPAADLSAAYLWEEGSSATLHGYSHMVGSTTSNGSLLYGAAADLRYRLRTKAFLLAQVQTYHLTDSGSAVGVPVEERATNAGHLGAEYLLREGVAVRLIGGYEQSWAQLGEDYERWSGSLVTAVAF